MSWNNIIKPSVALATLMVMGITAASAATIVVKSSGPSAKSYPPGKSIPDSTRIALKAGDQVVLLDSRGTRTLQGPGQFSATLATTVAANVGTRDDASKRRSRTGATRSLGAPQPSTPVEAEPSWNIWFVDINRSTTVCVPDAGNVTMWRPNGGAAGTVTITSLAGGNSEKVNWLTGQSRRPWPASVPVVDGGQYKLSWAGAAQPTTLKFSVLGRKATGLEDMAATLIKNGCEAQLDTLIETVAIPDGGNGPTG